MSAHTATETETEVDEEAFDDCVKAEAEAAAEAAPHAELGVAAEADAKAANSEASAGESGARSGAGSRAALDDSEENDEFIDAEMNDALLPTELQLLSSAGDAHKASNDDATQTLSIYGGRTRLPSLGVNKDFSLLQFLKHCIGKDLSTITMPVILNEPLGFLQRLAEHMEYYQLLLQALEHDDKLRRVELVAAFAVSNCANNGLRLNKPFNPLLGETYEFKRKALGDLHFVAEQVSHHPPVSAYIFEIPGKFRFTGSIGPEVHFRGKYIDVTPTGVMTLEFPEYGDVYTWESPRLNVNNLIFGKMWLEIVGDVEVKNHTNACRAVVSFKRSGWFGKQSRKLEGFVYNQKDEAVRALYGDWSEGLFSAPMASWEAHRAASSNDSASTPWYSLIYQYTSMSLNSESQSQSQTPGRPDARSGLQCDMQLKEQRLLWKTNKLPESSALYYNFSLLTLTLNEITSEDVALGLPPTDSRYRGDVRHLEQGNIDAAAAEKHRLEEKQRTVRRERKAKNVEWTPLWFELKAHRHLGRPTWIFNDKYMHRDWSRSPDIY